MAECEKIMQLCEESIDRTLSPEEQELLEQHLQSCPGCTAYLADLQFMTAALAEEPEFPDGLHAAIMSGIRAEERSTVVQTSPPRRRLPVFTMLAAAAACVVLVLSGALGDLMYTFEFGGAGGSSSSAGADGGNAAPAAGNEASADMAAATAEEGAGFMPFAADTEDAGIPAEGQMISRSAKTSGQDAPEGEAALPETALENDELPSDAISGSNAENGSTLQPQVGAFISNVMEGEVFAACYLVEGGENLPDIGQEQQRGEHFGYYTADNNLAQLETIFDALEKAGCTVRAYEEGGVLFNETAHRVIFVVRLE